MFTSQGKVQLGKSTYLTINRSENAYSAGKQANFPSITSLIGRVHYIFSRKVNGPNPSEMDIKVFIPAPTFFLQTRRMYFPKFGKIKSVHN